MNIESSRGKNGLIAIVIAAAVLFATAGALYYFHPSPRHSRSTSASPEVNPFLSEFATPGTGSLPNAIAVDSRGNVWTVLQNETELAEFFPTNSTFRVFHFPEAAGTKVMTWGLSVDNSRHLVWIADETSNAIWTFNMTSRSFREVAITLTGATPYQVVLDNSGDAWFTEFVGDRLGEVSVGGTLTEIQIPIVGNPTGLTVDSQGRVWFNLLQTEGDSARFYVGSYSGGSFTFSNLTGLVDTPVGIAVDGHGNVWLTQHGASLIAEFDPSSGSTRTFSTSIPQVGASYPYFVCVDAAHGTVWFNEHYGNAIGELNPATGTMVEYLVPPGPAAYGNISGVLTMGLAPSGTPWFSEVYTGRIGSVRSTSPLGISLSMTGIDPSQPITIASGASATVHLEVAGNPNEAGQLSASVGALTSPLSFEFAPHTGRGNYTSAMTISDTTGAKGTFYVTVSVRTQDFVVSQVLEVELT